LFNASLFVEEGLRYAISFDKIINTSGNRKLMFRSLAPKMEVEISIIWKKYQVFPNQPKKFLQVLTESVQQKNYLN